MASSHFLENNGVLLDRIIEFFMICDYSKAVGYVLLISFVYNMFCFDKEKKDEANCKFTKWQLCCNAFFYAFAFCVIVFSYFKFDRIVFSIVSFAPVVMLLLLLKSRKKPKVKQDITSYTNKKLDRRVRKARNFLFLRSRSNLLKEKEKNETAKRIGCAGLALIVPVLVLVLAGLMLIFGTNSSRSKSYKMSHNTNRSNTSKNNVSSANMSVNANTNSDKSTSKSHKKSSGFWRKK